VGFPRLSFYVHIVVHFALETNKCIGIHKALLGFGDMQDSATQSHVDCHGKFFFKPAAPRHVPEYDKLGGFYDNPRCFSVELTEDSRGRCGGGTKRQLSKSDRPGAYGECRCPDGTAQSVGDIRFGEAGRFCADA
jgi:hypothetical protein